MKNTDDNDKEPTYGSSTIPNKAENDKTYTSDQNSVEEMTTSKSSKVIHLWNFNTGQWTNEASIADYGRFH